jgi:monofunctional biosynthetic peptidoglycan transglycosylase
MIDQVKRWARSDDDALWASNLMLLRSPWGSYARLLRRLYRIAATVAVLGLALLAPRAWLRPTTRVSLWQQLTAVVGCFLAAPVLLFKWVNPPVTPFMLCTGLGWRVDDPTPPRAIHKWVSIERIAPEMVLAVVVSEDAYFFWHFGINPIQIWRAFAHNRAAGNSVDRREGGSTLTQQLAKNLFLLPAQSYARKVLELPLSLLIEAIWSKRRILETYLNVVHFGEGVFGVEAAAEYFFQQPASALTAEQAALLTAALRRPYFYRVSTPPPSMRRIQSEILERMATSGEWMLAHLEPK